MSLQSLPLHTGFSFKILYLYYFCSIIIMHYMNKLPWHALVTWQCMQPSAMHGEPHEPRRYCACDSWWARPIDPKLNARKLWATKHLAHRERGLKDAGRSKPQCCSFTLNGALRKRRRGTRATRGRPWKRGKRWKQDVFSVQSGLYGTVVVLMGVYCWYDLP